ncbi:MAG: VWA domain-containing protein [Planctomycetes bacterium]|nr:VWA domain-containing protein [Planctomycetota bacterium]
MDASDSMNERGKFDRARYELLHSIEQLASDQRYFVIFFNDGAYPMDADEPVLATEKERAKTVNWVNESHAHGGTNPLPALLHALSLRPDAIFFLSDGQFHPLAIEVLRAHNRPSRRIKMRQIPIHTIAFVDHMTIGLMRTIARNSGGEHRFVK